VTQDQTITKQLRDLVLERCGFRDGAEVTADGSADNDLAHERADAVMRFIERVSRHVFPDALLEQTTTDTAVPELYWSPDHGLIEREDGTWWHVEKRRTSLSHNGLPNERPADAVRLAPDTADARDVWDGSVAPGGYVCATCGTPTESEPCAEHQPDAWREAVQTTDTADESDSRVDLANRAIEKARAVWPPRIAGAIAWSLDSGAMYDDAAVELAKEVLAWTPGEASAAKPLVIGNIQLPDDFADKITPWLIGARPSISEHRYEEMARNLDEHIRATYHPFADAHYEDCPSERFYNRGDCNCLEVARELAKLPDGATVLPDDWREQIQAAYERRITAGVKPRFDDVFDLIESWRARPAGESGDKPGEAPKPGDRVRVYCYAEHGKPGHGRYFEGVVREDGTLPGFAISGGWGHVDVLERAARQAPSEEPGETR
jgi:hypothetical protein